MGPLGAYRRAGADPPLGDPRGYHGVPMEGYYWRLTHPASGRVVVALCGVLARPDGPEALMALAAAPGGLLASARAPVTHLRRRGLGLEVGDRFRARADRLTVDLGPGALLDLRLDPRPAWRGRALGGLGLAQLVPGLSQYWHPHAPGGAVWGTAELGGQRMRLDGAELYAEKNWGARFPERWWWGQAQGFDVDACVAFAGGRLRAGPLALPATALVVRLEGRLMRLVAPAALVRAEVGEGSWRIRARGPALEVRVEAAPGPAPPVALPVPGAQPGEADGVVHQHLAGMLSVTVRQRARTLWRGESRVAGLEAGALERAVERHAHHQKQAGRKMKLGREWREREEPGIA